MQRAQLATAPKEPFSLDKLRRWLAARGGQVWRRRLYLRKPVVYAARPFSWWERRAAARRVRLAGDEPGLVTKLQARGMAPAPGLVAPDLLAEVDALVQRRLAEGLEERRSGKTFWRPMLREDDFESGGPIVRYALQDGVLRVASAYLGQIPHLSRLELVATIPSADADWRISQRWHRDHNDSRSLKLFTYFTDVEKPEDGPFTFIPADICERLRDPLFPIHKTDALMERIGGTEHAEPVFGPRGTAFLIDTARCYHFGSRITGSRMRIALILTYSTFASYVRYDNRIKVTTPVKTLERMAIEG